MRQKPFYIAHRGYSSKYLENSKKAFQEALKCQIDMIETDIRLSKDNEWVLSHDPSLIRMASISKRIRNLKAIFLQKKGILSLKEFLQYIFKHGRPNLKIYLDIKGRPALEDLHNLLNIIYDSKKSFRHYYLASFNRQVVEKLMTLRLTCPRFSSISPAGNFQIGIISYPIAQLHPKTIKSLNFFSISAKELDQAYYQKLRDQRSFQIFVYTLNKLESLQKYKDMGVDGLLSDDCKLFGMLK